MTSYLFGGLAPFHAGIEFLFNEGNDGGADPRRTLCAGMVEQRADYSATADNPTQFVRRLLREVCEEVIVLWGKAERGSPVWPWRWSRLFPTCHIVTS
jgi:hypothetical protein